MLGRILMERRPMLPLILKLVLAANGWEQTGSPESQGQATLCPVRRPEKGGVVGCGCGGSSFRAVKQLGGRRMAPLRGRGAVARCRCTVRVEIAPKRPDSHHPSFFLLQPFNRFSASLDSEQTSFAVGLALHSLGHIN